jgi:hypothetical protein
MTKSTNVPENITKKDVDELLNRVDRTLLESKIERTRDQMVTTGMDKGLSHPDTIELSQKLDRLLNEQMKLNK